MCTINSILHHFTALKRRAATLHRIKAAHCKTSQEKSAQAPHQHHTAHTSFYYCPHYNTKHVKN